MGFSVVLETGVFAVEDPCTLFILTRVLCDFSLVFLSFMSRKIPSAIAAPELYVAALDGAL